MFDDPSKNAGPRYDYRCTECGEVHEEDFRESMFVRKCAGCFETTMHKRVYSAFFHKPMLHEHFNHSVGQVITDYHQYDEVLKRTSDQHANELNMDVNYRRVDMGDAASVGATGEGLYEANMVREKSKDPDVQLYQSRDI